MAKVIERVAEHYDIQEVEYGHVYKWRPESVLIECECAETVAITASETTCEECGAEHIGLVREDLTDRQLGDEDLHPWRYSKSRAAAAVLPY
jgi:hypothetical protein